MWRLIFIGFTTHFVLQIVTEIISRSKCVSTQSNDNLSHIIIHSLIRWIMRQSHFNITYHKSEKKNYFQNNWFWLPDKNSSKTQFKQQNCLNCTRKRFLTMPSWAEYCVNRLASLKKSSAQAKRDYALIQSISESDSTGKAFHCF